MTVQITEQFPASLRATLATDGDAQNAAADAELADMNTPTSAPLPAPVPREIRDDAVLLKIFWRRFKMLFGWRGPEHRVRLSRGFNRTYGKLNVRHRIFLFRAFPICLFRFSALD